MFGRESGRRYINDENVRTELSTVCTYNNYIFDKALTIFKNFIEIHSTIFTNARWKNQYSQTSVESDNT